MVLSDQMVSALVTCTALTREKGERGRREAVREAVRSAAQQLGFQAGTRRVHASRTGRTRWPLPAVS
jgi:hypothetical protein